MITTPNLSLIAWNLPSDPYNSEELAENWIKVDQHDHTPGKGARIDTAAIEDQAVTSAKIHPAAFPDLTIADGSITTAKIADVNVTLGKLASNSVNSSKIVDGSIVTGDIAGATILRSNLNTSFIKTTRLAFTADTSATWTHNHGSTNYTAVWSRQSSTPDFYPFAITTKSANSLVISSQYSWTGTMHVILIGD